MLLQPDPGPRARQAHMDSNLEDILEDVAALFLQETPITALHSTHRTLHRFPQLPTELQLEILRHILPNQRTIIARTHVLFYGPLFSKLSVNKHMRCLAARVYYGENTFKLQRSRFATTRPHFLRLPKSVISHHMRRIEISVPLDAKLSITNSRLAFPDVSGSSAYMPRPADIFTLIRLPCAKDRGRGYKFPSQEPSEFLTPEQFHLVQVLPLKERSDFWASVPRWGSYMRTRFCDNRPGSLTHWQKHFTGLQELKITVEVDGCIKNAARGVLEMLSEQAVISLRSDKIEIVASVKGCKQSSESNMMDVVNACDGKCADIIQRAFLRMMEN
jgi:hypothetical protein